jgi:DNA-binding XRE family transcriptional regulator
VKGRYQPELHLALGLMRMFNADVQCSTPPSQAVSLSSTGTTRLRREGP